MSFSVYYKFKSQRQESRVTFDGTGISVFDLKKEIILQNNLKAVDIDLLLFDHADQEYKDDSFIIPRSTSVLAKRMPASRPGRGRAAMYVANVGAPSANTAQITSTSNAPSGQGNQGGFMGSGRGNTGRFQGQMSQRFDGKDVKPPSAPPSAPAPSISVTGALLSGSLGGGGGDDDEAAQIAAMFAETSEQWEETQEKMAQGRAVYNNYSNRGHAPNRGGHSGQPRPPHQPDTRPLPPGYICHRCNRKGHWIQDCPTNDNREYDNRPRVKRTTGIPRSFLKSVDISAEGSSVKGVMVTPEGGFVVAEPDSAAWERQRARPKGLTEADVKERAPKDPALACPLCSKVLKDAVKTPCCQTSYCEECIHTHLLEGTFECPNCNTRIPSLDKLKIDSEMRAKVREYIRDAVEESRREVEEAVDSGQPTHTKTTPEPKDEEFSEVQPGNELGGADDSAAVVDTTQQQQQQQQQQAFVDPRNLITPLQAQLAQLMLMQNNPTLPPMQRMSIANQIQALTFQLKQAEHFRDMMAMGGMNGGGGRMGMMSNHGMNNGMNGGGMGMMGQGMGMGMQQPGMGRGFGAQQHLGQQQFGMQQQQSMQGIHPAYDRMPVNNRRVKRDRPEDFGDGGPDSKRQYWE